MKREEIRVRANVWEKKKKNRKKKRQHSANESSWVTVLYWPCDIPYVKPTSCFVVYHFPLFLLVVADEREGERKGKKKKKSKKGKNSGNPNSNAWTSLRLTFWALSLHANANPIFSRVALLKLHKPKRHEEGLEYGLRKKSDEIKGKYKILVPALSNCHGPF